MPQQRPSDSIRDFESLVRKVEALERALAGSMQVLSAADAQINTQYVDDVDGKIYFKDAASVSHALY